MADDPKCDDPGCLGCIGILVQFVTGGVSAAVIIIAATGGISYTFEAKAIHDRLQQLEAEVEQLRKEADQCPQ